MDGIHDMGGMAGFGAINMEPNEPVFHHPWEGRAYAMNILAIGVLRAYNTDEYRHALERMKPLDYLDASYYERVLTGVASLLLEKGIVTKEELTKDVEGRYVLAQPNAIVKHDGKSMPSKPRFNIGDRVVVKPSLTQGHTRVPRYVRGHEGEVLRVTPFFSYPDTAAHGLPFRKEATYHVLFQSSDLWHDDSLGDDTVVVDLWESYLESAV